jgi:hypothetical protein
MNKTYKSGWAAGLLGLLALSSWGVQAAVIDFDSVPAGAPIVSSYSEDGFTFTSSHFHTISSGAACGSGGCADNGSGYIGEEDGSLGDDIYMARDDGGVFSLAGFDAAELFISAPSSYPNANWIEVVGDLFGGGTVMATFFLDGIVDGAGGSADFQSFFMAADFTNLIGVTFAGLTYDGTGGLALDNIRVNVDVPEPQSLALLLLGVFLMAVQRRRRMR